MTLEELSNLLEDLLNELRNLNENLEKNNRLLESAPKWMRFAVSLIDAVFLSKDATEPT